MISAENRYFEVAKLLIPYEAGIRSNLGKSALYFAVIKNQVEIAELLLPLEGHLADIGGKIPADYAGDASQEMRALFARHGPVAQRSEPFQPVSKCSGKATNLVEAAREGCVECVKKCIKEAGKLVGDRTALMESAWYGHLEITKLLIPHEVKMKREDGWTALMISAWYGHLEITKLLIPHEAKMQTKDGVTALMSSARNGHPEVAKLLIDHEAGIKANDDQTATTYAISSYQRSCLPLLLANEAEREASQIPRIMLAAYHGDIPYLLEHQSDWSTKHNRMAVLDFALLGGQRRAVRLLVGSQEARRSFAEKFGFRFDVWNPIGFARRFLSANASFMLDIAPAVHLMNVESKSRLLLVSLIEQIDNASHILRAICTPDAGSMLRYLGRWCDEPQAASVLAGLKHVGFSNGGKTVENLAKERDGPVQKYLASNPLKRAQIRRAEKEAEKRLPNKKQAAFREIGAESAFNRSLLTGSRDATQSASGSCRLVHNPSTSSIKQKQAWVNLLLAASYQFMYRVVQAMLDD